MQTCNFAQTTSSAKTNYGATQLCTRLKCGIIGRLHAAQEVCPETDEWENKGGIPKGATIPSIDDIVELGLVVEEHSNQLYHPTNAVVLLSESTCSWYEPDTGFGSLLFDSKYEFNQLRTYTRLWHIHHLQVLICQFVFKQVVSVLSLDLSLHHHQ